MIKNVFAYGFDNLTLKARLHKADYTSCQWVVEGKNYDDLGVDFTTIFNNVAQCGDAVLCHEENIDGVIYVNTNLTISKPITYNPRVYILCDSLKKILVWNGFSKSKLTLS